MTVRTFAETGYPQLQRILGLLLCSDRVIYHAEVGKCASLLIAVTDLTDERERRGVKLFSLFAFTEVLMRLRQIVECRRLLLKIVSRMSAGQRGLEHPQRLRLIAHGGISQPEVVQDLVSCSRLVEWPENVRSLLLQLQGLFLVAHSAVDIAHGVQHSSLGYRVVLAQR